MSKKFALATAVALALANSTAGAVDLGDMFSIRGYGTLGILHSDEDQADYVRDNFTQPAGAGFSDSWSAVVDSKAGLQVDMKFTERFSGVVQLVSESAHNNTWDGDLNNRFFPSLEWANLSYQLTDDLTVRAGRVVLPFLMHSEYQKVGFASHWMRSPLEVYGQLPFSTSDGGDITYKMAHGNVISTLRGSYGGQTFRASELFKLQLRLLNLNYTLQAGDLTARVAYMKVKNQFVNDFGLTPLFNQFADAADLFGAAAASQRARTVGDALDRKFHENDYYALGLTYDPGAWFVMAELVRNDAKSAPGWTAGYVSGGVRINKFTPYATFAKTDPKDFPFEIPLEGLPPPVADFGALLNGITATLPPPADQQTASVGLRWDVHGGIALKAQYDRVMIGDDSPGLLVNVQPGFVAGGNVNVFGLSVDFVF